MLNNLLVIIYNEIITSCQNRKRTKNQHGYRRFPILGAIINSH